VAVKVQHEHGVSTQRVQTKIYREKRRFGHEPSVIDPAVRFFSKSKLVWRAKTIAGTVAIERGEKDVLRGCESTGHEIFYGDWWLFSLHFLGSCGLEKNVS
jgi:hypothetical protein